MSVVHQIPFRSFKKLRDWRQSEEAASFEDEWLDDVLVPGFKGLFKEEDPVISVFDYAETEEHPLFVDVYFELRDRNGEICQPWLLTFISPSGLKAENEKYQEVGSRKKASSITLDELTNPFPHEDILWKCDYFTPEETLKAVDAWSQKMWPDFSASFRYGLASEEEFQWIRKLLDQVQTKELPDEVLTLIEQVSNSELFIIGSKEDLGQEFLDWLDSKGYIPIPIGSDELAVNLPHEAKEEIQEKWPFLNFRPAFDFDFELH